MTLTRNTHAYYVAPGTVAGTPVQGGGTTLWTLGGAVATGLMPGIYDLPWSKAFQLNDVINSGDFTSLFDAYYIKRVTVTFRITSLATAAAPTASTILSAPTVFWYQDSDDNLVPSVGDVRERMGVRSKQLIPGRAVVIRVTPKADIPVYTAAGALSGAAVGRPKQWLDTGVANIPHYGLKGLIAGMDLRAVATPFYQIEVNTRYTIALKDVK